MLSDTMPTSGRDWSHSSAAKTSTGSGAASATTPAVGATPCPIGIAITDAVWVPWSGPPTVPAVNDDPGPDCRAVPFGQHW